MRKTLLPILPICLLAACVTYVPNAELMKDADSAFTAMTLRIAADNKSRRLPFGIDAFNHNRQPGYDDYSAKGMYMFENPMGMLSQYCEKSGGAPVTDLRQAKSGTLATNGYLYCMSPKTKLMFYYTHKFISEQCSGGNVFCKYVYKVDLVEIGKSSVVADTNRLYSRLKNLGYSEQISTIKE